MNDSLFIKAAKGKNNHGRPPVWFMRQAGRYMQEYRDIRAKHSFLEMCKTPELSMEITLQPIKVLGVDAAILFSDILLIAEAMGGQLEFIEGRGPVFHNPVRSLTDVERLRVGDVAAQLDYVYRAIGLTKEALRPYRVPLIGFAGAPFTVASYLVEGQSTRQFKTIKNFLYHETEAGKKLLQKITQVTTDYLNQQIAAGVDALQIFDSWADCLSWSDFQEFSLVYMKDIIQGLNNPRQIPIIVFCKGSSLFAPLLVDSGADVISLDWHCDMAHMRSVIPQRVALQGNLDPALLCAPRDLLKRHVMCLLESMRTEPGYIFSLGHGITPDVPVDTVKYVVDVAKESVTVTER